MQLLASRALCSLLFLCQFLYTVKAQNYQYPGYDCDSTANFTSGSEYQQNLNSTLASLVVNASQTGYYTAITGQAPDAVFGLVQCRGTLLKEDCQTCANTVGNEIGQLCPNQKQAFMFNEDCSLQYSDQRFFAIPDDAVRLYLVNTNNVPNPTLFNNLLGNLLKNLSSTASADPSRLAFGSVSFSGSDNIYAMVQCSRDIASNDCLSCLQSIIANISENPTKEGLQIFSLSCFFRYEIYLFYQLSQAPAAPPPPSSLLKPAPSPPPSSLLQPKSTPTSRGAATNGGKSSNIVIIIVTPVAVAILLIPILCGCYIWRRAKRKNIVSNPDEAHEEYTNTGMESLLIGLDKLKAATRNFSDSYKLGEGGFGSVYKGKLRGGQEIAVKRLSSRSNQGMEELKTEVMLVAKLLHRNLVRLLGFCLDEEEKLLVYEYLPNGSLDKVLFDKNKRFTLEWERRYKIIVGIARGLLYLHEDSQLRVVHRDLKASNILLDESMNPKISDFGLARLFAGSQTQAKTKRIAGTYGYMAPEYVKRGHLSTKSDVYSYGILVLEIVTGQKNSSFRDSTNIQTYAWEQWMNGTAMQLLDPTLKEQCPTHEVLKCIHLGLLCVQESAADRPRMSDIVTMLNSYSVTAPAPQQPAFFVNGKTSSSDSATDNSDTSQSRKSETVSINEVSISILDPR